MNIMSFRLVAVCRVAGLAIGAAALAAVAMSGVAQAAEIVGALASHKAVYDMELASTRSNSGIVGAGGTMTYTFTNGCDGWTVETRTDLTMLRTKGGALATSWDFVSWEDKSGEVYRFRVRNMRDGQVIETYDGEARLTGNGIGSAVFRTGEEELVFELPAGTKFPTAHTVDLLTRAQEDTRFWSSPVFDGSSVQGAFQVTAAIGLPVDGTAAREPLLTGESWPMTLAFFPVDGKEDLPEFEVSLRYFMNGVALDILQNFGGFALSGTLKSLESTPRPGC